MNNKSFVMYESAFKQAEILEERLGKEKAYEFLKALNEFGLYGVLPDESSEVWLYGFEQTITSVSRAKDRHSAAIENGKKGGRTKIELSKEEVMAAKDELKTWKAVAQHFGVSEQTLKNKRKEWVDENPKNPKNPEFLGFYDSFIKNSDNSFEF